MELSRIVAGARTELGLGPIASARTLGGGAADVARALDDPAVRSIDLQLPRRDAATIGAERMGSRFRPHAAALWHLANGTTTQGTAAGPLDAAAAAAAREVQPLAHAALSTTFAEGALIGRSAMSRAPRVTGNSAQLLVQDAEYLPRLWDDLRAAERSVTVTMYNIEDAGSGDQLLRELADLKRTKPHLDIRVVVDAHGTNEPGRARGEAMLRRLADAGVDVAVSTAPWRRGGGGFEHRKMVLVDDRILYQGGLGFAGTEAGKYGTWMDAMVRMEGQVGAVGAVHSLAIWNHLTNRLDPATYARLGAAQDVLLGRAALEPRAGLLDAAAGAHRTVAGGPALDAPITLLENRPRYDLAITEQFLRDANSVGPGDEFWATSSYLTAPGASDAVQAAARNGADTRLVLSALSGDNDVLQIGIGRSFYPELLDSGVRLTQWEDRMMHHKSWMRRDADGMAASNVGSMNLSNMSLRYSRESTARIEGPDFAQQYARFHDTLRTTDDPTRFHGGHSRDVSRDDVGTEWKDHLWGAVRKVAPRAGF